MASDDLLLYFVAKDPALTDEQRATLVRNLEERTAMFKTFVDDLEKLSPEQRSDAAMELKEALVGTYRMTRAVRSIETHSRRLVILTSVLIAWTVILAGLTVVLIVAP